MSDDRTWGHIAVDQNGTEPFTWDRIEAELRQAVMARPNDDLPRDVLADYLADRGDPRATMIRLQLRLARNRHKPEGRTDGGDEAEADTDAEAEVETLLESLAPAILPAASNNLTFFQIERGFVSGIAAPLSVLTRFPTAWFASEPLASLVVTSLDVRLDHHLPRLLEAAPWQSVTLRGGLGFLGGQEMTVYPWPTSLTALTLVHPNLTVRGAAEIWNAEAFPSLTTLAFQDESLGPETIDIFRRGQPRPALRRLGLARASLGDAGMIKLLSWSGLSTLTWLDVSQIPISVATWEMFLASPYRPADQEIVVDRAMATSLRRAGLLGEARFTVESREPWITWRSRPGPIPAP